MRIGLSMGALFVAELVKLAATRWLRRHWPVLSAFLSLAFTTLAIDLLSRIGLVRPSLLALTPGTPWGVLTSMLVHLDFYHLLANLSGLSTVSASLLALFTVSSVFLESPRNVSRLYARAYLAALLLPHISISAFSLLSWLWTGSGAPLYGLSNVIFGLVGLLLYLLTGTMVYLTSKAASMLLTATPSCELTTLASIAVSSLLAFLLYRDVALMHLGSLLVGLLVSSLQLSPICRDIRIKTPNQLAEQVRQAVQEAWEKTLIASSRYP